ncbi:hypothetical protein [Sphingomonas oryzagri]
MITQSATTFGRPTTILTTQQRNTIADMLALNIPLSVIAGEVGSSPYLVRKAIERRSFQDLLARKKAAVAKALEATR